jgi:16S rRNA (cytosine1402-N4)-methyltransferase
MTVTNSAPMIVVHRLSLVFTLLATDQVLGLLQHFKVIDAASSIKELFSGIGSVDDQATILSDDTNHNQQLHRRRPRYQGSYPREYSQKYKELRGDEDVVAKVISKGMTPAGTHIPIMLQECLQHLGLSSTDDTFSNSSSFTVVDCTLGYGGHSSKILSELLKWSQSGKHQFSSFELIAFDQDEQEIIKTETRMLQRFGDDIRATNGSVRCTFVNRNFEQLYSYLETRDMLGKIDCLLVDLGVSSMQIDNQQRGFTYKREAPLDMRMSQTSTNMTAMDLLSRLNAKQLASILEENSDEVYAKEIAHSLLGKHTVIPTTTLDLAEQIRSTVRPLFLARYGIKDESQLGKKKTAEMKRALDSTVARTMQAIRIEVNGEFRVLEKLLQDLPSILKPGGNVVFLTFHSGEDRRVKKAFKTGFNNGIYSSWSRDVVRPTIQEMRSNSRSTCCKLRWAVRTNDRNL